MARSASKCIFLFFLSLLTFCSSGTLVGFSVNARNISAVSSHSRTISSNEVPNSHTRVLIADFSSLRVLSDSSFSVDLHLNESLVESLISSESFAISYLKTQILSFLPHINLKSMSVSGSNDLSKSLSTLKSVHSVLSSFGLDNDIKVSVALSWPLLKNMNRTQENELKKILEFIKLIESFIILEANTDLGIELNRAGVSSYSTTSLLSCKDVPIVIVTKNVEKVAKSSRNNEIAEASSMGNFGVEKLNKHHEQVFPHRELIVHNFKSSVHDIVNPPTTIFPAPVTLPSDNPNPGYVTIPATNPANVMPTNPAAVTPTNPTSTPIPLPSTTPVSTPSTTPAITTPAVPITNPVTTPAPITVPGAQPITNPVTTYPAPVGNAPVTVPVTNPVAPPATTNAPAIPGQSWCVAKSGTLEASLQSALDYACGMGGADCSQIQQGGSCYNPDTLQNHASYAFNSYYQRNPAPTSCDFGGTAYIVNVNPSVGSCIYSTSSSLSTPSLPTPTTSAANPATPVSVPGSVTSGTGTPPSVLNSSSPGSSSTTSFGSVTPPGFETSTSTSTSMQPFISCIILLTSLVARMIVLHM